MPLYEYQCAACGRRFEVIQKFSDPPLEACTTCGGPVEKLLSSPAIQFKGSGWYITDYARAGKSGGEKPSSKASESSAGAAGDDKKSGETKSESKSESKSETKSDSSAATKTDAKPS